MPSKPPRMTMGTSGQRKPWAHRQSSATKRGYGREHARLRAILLEREPLCRSCQAKTPPRVTVATIADHIVSIAKGGAIHDITNLQPLCRPCHDEKTLAEQGKRYRHRRATAPDGWPVED